MKRNLIVLSFVGFTFMTLARDSPDDPCTAAQLRPVTSFDVQKGLLESGGSYTNQLCFERMLTQEDCEIHLRRSYFNGTSEAKAYALLGLSYIKSPLYAQLKLDFLRYENDIVVGCRVIGLKAKETPATIVAAIDSGKLSAEITPRKRY